MPQAYFLHKLQTWEYTHSTLHLDTKAYATHETNFTSNLLTY